jgi:hypothetical protein
MGSKHDTGELFGFCLSLQYRLGNAIGISNRFALVVPLTGLTFMMPIDLMPSK